MARSRRKNKQGSAFTDFAIDTGETQAAMENATSQAIDDLPAVAREVLADELRPHIREQLTSDVLQGIGDMVNLMPLVQAALADDLSALTPMFVEGTGDPLLDEHGEQFFLPDYDRRQKAVGMVLKYTLGQAGLAPQPEAPEQAPITVVFPTMPAPPPRIEVDTEGVAIEVLELEEGERQCDICNLAKPVAEFVGSSPRCTSCHGAQRARIEAAIVELSPKDAHS